VPVPSFKVTSIVALWIGVALAGGAARGGAPSAAAQALRAEATKLGELLLLERQG